MSLNAEPLRKILDLEQKKGYLDAAVMGGLSRFLRKWGTAASASVTDSRLLSRFQQLTKSEYDSLTPSQREKWVADVRAWLADAEHGADNKTGTTKVARAPASPPKSRRSATPGNSLDSPVSAVKGIGPSLAERFNKMGLKTVRDLLYFFPHRHLDYSQRQPISQLKEGEEQTIIANVWEAREVWLGGRKSTEAAVGDETGNVRVVWFNNPYLAKKLTPNDRIVLSGRVRLWGGRLEFQSPQWELLEDKELVHTGRLVPLYSLTEGMRPRQVRKVMKEVVDRWAGQLTDFLPPGIIQRDNLLGLPQAVTQAHFPDNEVAKDRARVRLAFDELFLLQIGVLTQKRHWQESQPGNPFDVNASILNTFTRSLPFSLTDAQQKVLREILTDLRKSQPMCRLLQGDVGSGKTVVATAALLVAVANGYQGAFMAPTEILAEQHFNTICQLLARVGQEEVVDDGLCRYSGLLPRPLNVAMLIGDITPARKREMRRLVAAGEVDIVIGTHALIQKGVEFRKLGLAVVDEQHRFGVEQRSALRQKGFNPHMLVMTATPIPRTLALTLYGDLDLAVIDQLPPGRQAVKTRWLGAEKQDSAYAWIHKEVASGRQAFIICPLIEESEAVQAKAAVAEYERLSAQVFPDLRLGLLHGRMSAVDKDKVMRRFRAGELDILVSTAVVEVGIDVPNATVMLVESADRFGLSQLHQFRGRVGRGREQSYCILLTEEPSEIGRRRLDIIQDVQSGFVLAEEDLKLRGPGEFFGTRQSGLPDLRMAQLTDVSILEMARAEAIKLFEIDPQLKKPEHKLLAKELARVWQTEGEWS